MAEPLFDQYAGNYDEALNRGLAVSGESKDYFAEHRVRILSSILQKQGFVPRRVLDFGCGTGSAIRWLLSMGGVECVVGADVSDQSVRAAAHTINDSRVSFTSMDRLDEEEPFDLVFCNGVFHHIPVQERAKALQLVRCSLRDQGFFALWENNPWNPGTRYVMSRIPFDRDAVTISPVEADQLIVGHGFRKILRTHAFIFPASLGCLRWSERWLQVLPIGAQYMVLGQNLLVNGSGSRKTGGWWIADGK
jgi:trans-aconitate methyltransferase